MITTVLNGTLLDTTTMTLVGQRHLVIEDDLIVEVAEAVPTIKADRSIDAGGRFLMPGFIDGHVHHVITTMDFPKLSWLSSIELSLGMAHLAMGFVSRGFTTVRDTGGDIAGLVRAIETGLCDGPRIIRSGRGMSQTGGHGDFEPDTGPLCLCQIGSTTESHIVDSPDAMRLAVRRELRDGSNFIKINTSGGVASPSDPMDSVQFTAEEVRTATIETDHRNTYTTAHAYHPAGILNAIENGVRGIEHGNLLDAPTARRMAELDVTMCPTLSTYWAMQEMGAELGLPRRNLEKNAGVLDAGLASISIARQAGVSLGFGTDLLGEAQVFQNREFAIRAELEPAADVLRSMYHTNAELCGLTGRIGVLAPGAYADVVVTNVDPLANLAGLADDRSALDAVICRGDVAHSRLG